MLDIATVFKQKAEELTKERTATAQTEAGKNGNGSGEAGTAGTQRESHGAPQGANGSGTAASAEDVLSGKSGGTATEEKPAEVAEAEKKAAEDKAKAEEENKKIKDARRQELLNESIPSYLKDGTGSTGEQGSEGKTEAEKGRKAAISAEVQAEIEKIKNQYEEKYGVFENDPLVKGIAQWRKNGGEDINEFLKETGMTDVKKLSVEDLFREEGAALELSGEDLEEYVADKKGEYEGLKIGRKKELERELRSKYSQKLEQRTQKYIEQSSIQKKQESARRQELIDFALTELNSKISELKEYNGLAVDERIRTEIAKVAPEFSTAVMDKEKGLLGFDTEAGIRTAILQKFEKELLRVNYTNGYTAGYDAAMSQRTRISENNGTQTIVHKSAEDNLAAAKKNFLKK